MEVEKFLHQLKSDVKRLKDTPREGVKTTTRYYIDLTVVIQHIEIVESEYFKSELERDYDKIRYNWRKACTYASGYDVFVRFKGNAVLKKKLLDFLNGPF